MAAALPVVVAAIIGVITSSPPASVLAGTLVFTLAAIAAEFKPVPLDESGSRMVSLSFVFLLSAQLLFGWQLGVLAAVITIGVVGTVESTPLLRRGFNAAVYALAVLASAIPGMLLGIHSTAIDPVQSDRLTLLAFLGGAAYVAVNVVLVSVVVWLATGTELRQLLIDNVRHSGPVFVIMAFIAGLAASLWVIRPQLEVLLAGPLFALVLYQRYAYRSWLATRDAETDALTGLGNHRGFHTDLREALALAASTRTPVTLCLIDLDNFKSINDRFGHPIGDQVLVTVAEHPARRAGRLRGLPRRRRGVRGDHGRPLRARGLRRGRASPPAPLADRVRASTSRYRCRPGSRRFPRTAAIATSC